MGGKIPNYLCVVRNTACVGAIDHDHLSVTCWHVLHTGYDNMEVNLEPVLDYIKAQNYKALEYEQNAKRVSSMNKWEV
jgi:septin family protein